MMMTFTEIDERITHYEKELETGSTQLKTLEDALEKITDNAQKQLLERKKMTVSFFSFVTTAYIDLLCSYKNLSRSKSEWEKFFNLKISYLIIYETINTYHHFKKELYKTITQEEKEDFQQFFR